LNVGIFAGGFKPFHVGHFSRLCQSVRECDKTYIFYGVSPRKKGSEVTFSEKNALQVFNITKRAINKKYGDRVEVIKSTNPVTSVYETIIENHGSKNTVRLFGRESDLKKYYKSYIGTQKEKKYFGNMLSENRLIFIDDASPTIISEYFPDKSSTQLSQLIELSGSQFRKNIEDAKINDLFDSLPPILSLRDKIDILLGLNLSLSNSNTVSHIDHLYEMIDLTVNEFHDLINDVANGSVQDMQEKMDGQNLTFTFYNDQIRFLTKGPNITRILNSAKGRSEIIEDYGHMPEIRDAFLWAMDLIEPVALSYSHLFKGGLVVVEAALLHHKSSNTIAYDKDQIRIIGPSTPIGGVLYNEVGFKELFKDLEIKTQGTVSMVPVIDKLGECDSQFLQCIHDEFRDAVFKDDKTIQDVLVSHAVQHIKRETALNDCLLYPGALRLVTGSKCHLTRKMCNQIGPEQWKVYKEIEADRKIHMMIIREPIESLLVKLHNNIQSRITRNLNCTNINEINSFIDRDIHDLSCEEEKQCILFIKNRIEMLDHTEGIVFKWRGRLTKLTGHFTRLNRARWIARRNQN